MATALSICEASFEATVPHATIAINLDTSVNQYFCAVDNFPYQESSMVDPYQGQCFVYSFIPANPAP